MPEWNIGQPINRNAPLNRGLLSWWFGAPVQVSNARWLDIAGRAHGTITTGPVWGGARSRPGGYRSMAFDGTNGGVSAAFTAQPATLTWHAFVRFTSLAAFGYVFHQETSGVSEGFGFYATATEARGYIRIGAAWSDLIVVGFPGLDTWHALTATYDGATHRVYLNGVQTASASIAGSITYSASPLFLGVGPASTGRLNGHLDDTRVYGRALAADEVANLYQASGEGYKTELNWLTPQLGKPPAVAAATLFPPWPQRPSVPQRPQRVVPIIQYI